MRRHREVDPIIRLCSQSKFVGNVAVVILVAVGAVEDKKPTVMLNVDRRVAVVIAGRPERIGEQRVDDTIKVSPGLPTAVGADVGVVGAVRRVLVVPGLAVCGREDVVDAGRFAVKHRAIERKRLTIQELLCFVEEVGYSVWLTFLQRKIFLGKVVALRIILLWSSRIIFLSTPREQEK